MFNTTEVLPYLIERQILTPEIVTSERIRVANVTQRNQNFLVTNENSEGWFLKQGAERSAAGTVSNEAAVYQSLQGLSTIKQLAPYLPQFIDYDIANKLLSLEAIQNPEDLQKYHMRRNRFPKSIANSMGRSLGYLHAADPTTTGLNEAVPSVLQIHRPPINILQGISNIGLQLLKMLQRYGFGQFFDEILNCWHPESLIHCDVKISNFVAHRKSAKHRFQGIKIIDWEFAGVGDPRWDIGSVFASYLHVWLSSVPITNPESPDEHVSLARFSLADVQKTLRFFWAAYCKAKQIADDERLEWLLAATKCAAARLIQTAYEIANGANELSTEIVTLVQTSLNIFQNPAGAMTQLFGLGHES